MTLLTIVALAIAAAVDSPTACVFGENVLGCRTEAQLEEIAAMKRNVEAARRLSDTQLANGNCSRFAEGGPLVVDDESFFSERRKVHRPGDPVSYWLARSSTADAKDCHFAIAPKPAAPHAPPPVEAELGDSEQYVEPPRLEVPKSRAPAESPGCEIKPIMTDAELAACRAEKSHK